MVGCWMAALKNIEIGMISIEEEMQSSQIHISSNRAESYV